MAAEGRHLAIGADGWVGHASGGSSFATILKETAVAPTSLYVATSHALLTTFVITYFAQ